MEVKAKESQDAVSRLSVGDSGRSTEQENVDKSVDTEGQAHQVSREEKGCFEKLR